MSCKFSEIFGKPSEGVHNIRIFNIAIIDVIGTIFLAYFLSHWLELNFGISLILCFASGVFFHRLFCVRTTIDKLLFGI